MCEYGYGKTTIKGQLSGLSSLPQPGNQDLNAGHQLCAASTSTH